MHITDLKVDRFGIWRDLTLPLVGPGLNVLYGPNEAGKSTLTRFVKSILYGGIPPRADADFVENGDPEEVSASGSLRFFADGKPYVLSRKFRAHGMSEIEFRLADGEAVPEEELTRLLAGASEPVFDRVFSVDLYELQELATLDHKDLANHIYGFSLDARGKELLAAVDDLRRKRDLLLSAGGRKGRIARFLELERKLESQIRELPDLAGERVRFQGERDEIEGEVGRLKRRRGELQHELHGRRFLDRVYPAWSQVREYRTELAKLPPAFDLPADGLAQLDAIDEESQAFARRRDEARQKADNARARSDALGPEPEIVRAESAVRFALGLRDWLKEAIANRDAAAQVKVKPAKPSQRSLEALGPEWTEERIAAVDTSPQAQLALLQAARGYRTALGRRADLRKRYRRLHDATKKRETALEERLEQLGKSPDAVATDLRQRLASVETVVELRAKESAYSHRGSALRQRLEQLADKLEIPSWVTFVLAIFALSGAVFFVLGLVTGVTQNVIAGAAYLLLGVTAGSIALKLRSHFEEALQETAERVRDERYTEEAELRKVRDELARHDGIDGAAPAARAIIPLSAARSHAPASIADIVRDVVKDYAELDELVEDQGRIQRRRSQLTALRARLRHVQQGSEEARQNWCQTLIKLGLAETLDIKGSLALWQQIAEAKGAQPSVNPAEREFELLDSAIKAFMLQLEALGRRIGMWGSTATNPLAVLDEWEKSLDAALKQAEERKRHLDEHERAKRESGEANDRVNELARQRTAILASAGVKSRADYERKLQIAERRQELEELLELAEAELETLASAEPELAIVEEDLRAFKPQENAATMSRLAREQEELEARLESAHERRGRLSRQIDELEADDRGQVLRRRRARVEGILQQMTERWMAANLAERAAEQARAAYERDHQPPVLQAASESLARLTRNRYVRIWAPLGERALRVDDDHGRTFAVEQLSGGTREQLFLALRLGMVRHASQQGVELPLILDDVFVNFDQIRTEAAFETLRDFADEGRQVLFFTCHLHLAHLAESRGVDPIWLPGHQAPMQQRLAG